MTSHHLSAGTTVGTKQQVMLIVDLANQLLAGGLDALGAGLASAQSRLQSILMTAIALLLGFLHLVISSGASARSQRSLGTAVFGDLSVATVLSLFVVAVFSVELKGWLGCQATTTTKPSSDAAILQPRELELRQSSPTEKMNGTTHH